jgi:hypothetical protein
VLTIPIALILGRFFTFSIIVFWPYHFLLILSYTNENETAVLDEKKISSKVEKDTHVTAGYSCNDYGCLSIKRT